METSVDVIEAAAKAAYLANGGNEQEFPWPCRGAGRYRHIARAVLEVIAEDMVVTNIRCPNCDTVAEVRCPNCDPT